MNQQELRNIIKDLIIQGFRWQTRHHLLALTFLRKRAYRRVEWTTRTKPESEFIARLVGVEKEVIDEWLNTAPSEQLVRYHDQLRAEQLKRKQEKMAVHRKAS